MDEEKTKLSEELEIIELIRAGIDPVTAEKAARIARLGRESKIVSQEPDREAYLKELEYLEAEKKKLNKKKI
jgi:hypothetical protein